MGFFSFLKKNKEQKIYATIILLDEERNLIMGKQADGKLGFIGGGVEENETIEEGIKREVIEESGIWLSEVDKLNTVKVGNVEIHIYLSQVSAVHYNTFNDPDGEFKKITTVTIDEILDKDSYNSALLKYKHKDNVVIRELEKLDIDTDSVMSDKTNQDDMIKYLAEKRKIANTTAMSIYTFYKPKNTGVKKSRWARDGHYIKEAYNNIMEQSKDISKTATTMQRELAVLLVMLELRDKGEDYEKHSQHQTAQISLLLRGAFKKVGVVMKLLHDSVESSMSDRLERVTALLNTQADSVQADAVSSDNIVSKIKSATSRIKKVNLLQEFRGLSRLKRVQALKEYKSLKKEPKSDDKSKNGKNGKPRHSDTKMGLDPLVKQNKNETTEDKDQVIQKMADIIKKGKDITQTDLRYFTKKRLDLVEGLVTEKYTPAVAVDKALNDLIESIQ